MLLLMGQSIARRLSQGAGLLRNRKRPKVAAFASERDGQVFKLCVGRTAGCGRDMPDAVSRDEFDGQVRWTSWLRFMSVAISHASVLKASISSFSSTYPGFPVGCPSIALCGATKSLNEPIPPYA